jgi:hypothetical protein
MTKTQALIAALAAASSLVLSAPCRAGGYFTEEVIFIEPAPTVTYQDWLVRQLPTGSTLYNRPCTVSNGDRQLGVPCEAVAAALAGPLERGVFPAVPVTLAYPDDAPIYYVNGCYGRHHRRHAGPATRPCYRH